MSHKILYTCTFILSPLLTIFHSNSLRYRKSPSVADPGRVASDRRMLNVPVDRGRQYRECSDPRDPLAVEGTQKSRGAGLFVGHLPEGRHRHHPRSSHGKEDVPYYTIYMTGRDREPCDFVLLERRLGSRLLFSGP